MSPVKIPYAIEKVILNLSEARNNEHHPIGQMTNIFVRKLQDANAILTVRVGSSSAPEIPLEAGDSFPFDVEFSDLFFTNISGGAGAQAEIIVSKGVSPYRPQIITPDLLTRSLLFDIDLGRQYSNPFAGDSSRRSSPDYSAECRRRSKCLFRRLVGHDGKRTALKISGRV